MEDSPFAGCASNSESAATLPPRARAAGIVTTLARCIPIARSGERLPLYLAPPSGSPRFFLQVLLSLPAPDRRQGLHPKMIRIGPQVLHRGAESHFDLEPVAVGLEQGQRIDRTIHEHQNDFPSRGVIESCAYMRGALAAL